MALPTPWRAKKSAEAEAEAEDEDALLGDEANDAPSRLHVETTPLPWLVTSSLGGDGATAMPYGWSSPAAQSGVEPGPAIGLAVGGRPAAGQ